MSSSGGACVADGGASACDNNTETCVSVSGAPKCAKKYNPSNLQDIPEGVGLFTAMAFWWTIAGAVRRLRFGAGVLAVFIAKLPGLVLGVGMAIDTHVWYHAYGSGSAALQDAG